MGNTAISAAHSLIFRVNLTLAEQLLSHKAISSQPDFSVTCHMSHVPWKKNDLSQDHLKAETCTKPMAFWTLTLTSHPQRFQSPVWAFHREWPVTVHLRWIIACWCRLPYQQCKKQHCHSNSIKFMKIPAYFGTLTLRTNISHLGKRKMPWGGDMLVPRNYTHANLIICSISPTMWNKIPSYQTPWNFQDGTYCDPAYRP